MKKAIILAFFLAATSMQLFCMNTTQKHSQDCIDFHEALCVQQITKMLQHDRADELKLWLDQRGRKNDTATKRLDDMVFYSTFFKIAQKHNAQKCILLLDALDHFVIVDRIFLMKGKDLP